MVGVGNQVEKHNISQNDSRIAQAADDSRNAASGSSEPSERRQVCPIRSNAAGERSAAIVVPWKNQPHTILSHLDMMPFSARFFFVVLNALEGMQRHAAVQGIEIVGGQILPDTLVPPDETAHYLSMLGMAEQQCQVFGLQKI